MDLLAALQSCFFQILICLGLSLALITVYRQHRGIFPTINDRKAFEFSDERAKRNFVINGRRLLREGLAKYGGKPFRILTDSGYTVILSPAFAQETRNLSDVSHVKAIAKMVNAQYPGMEAFREFAFRDDLIQDVVRLKLTQMLGMLPISKDVRFLAINLELGSVTLPLSEETSFTLRETFTDNLEWHAIVPHKTLLGAVARVSSRLFLGDRLCRDAEWLEIITTYTTYVTTAVKQYNQYPALIRPFIGRFLPSVRELLRQVQKADKLMGVVLREREALEAAGKKPDYMDAIEWFKQTAKGRKYNPVYVQLTLSFVAIHTTADLITQVMFDLALNPEYIEPLREEVLQVLKTQGWKKTSLYNMKFLDSVLKETQRLRPINDTSMQRIALKDVTLSDGTVLKKNTIFAVASTCHWDSKYYPDPQKYDGYRFLKMREDPVKGNLAQFVSTSPTHLGFGHGQHACPGRFFASNEVKIIMCHILLKYDWRLVGDQEPRTLIHGFILAADHSTKLEIRRRIEEIDLDKIEC
ncbi:hypothetical protein N7510_010462 [Penicillium lagena]|uniref:uncharacterized protein n=1 Tax=Penicillium lagena TaxID=94218 RepID=UPI002541842D|nr:uncharacterized protein N7510_010462 [Penicillium lagena]KAJ5605308.1 hypothetical protein N7510_010462 [Penicillium lagena]